MTITDHGVFTQYTPEITDNFREDNPLRQNRTIFCSNEKNVDWYSLQGWIEPGAALVEVDPETGRFIGATGEGGTHDYSTRWPLNKRLLEIRPAEAAASLNTEWVYRGSHFVRSPQRRTFLFKTEIYERMSDPELEAFDAAMQGAPLRTRKMWGDCQHVDTASPLFTTLRHDMEEAFGKARADAILSLEAIPIATK